MFNAYLLVITKLVPHSLELLPPPCDSFMNIIPFVSTLAGPLFFPELQRLSSLSLSKDRLSFRSLSGTPQERIIKSSKLNLSGLAQWNPMKNFGSTEYLINSFN